MLRAELVIVPTALADRWSFVADKIIPTREWKNGMFITYVNWTGQENEIAYLGGSRVVGPDGELEKALAGKSEEILSAVLDKDRITLTRAKLSYLIDAARYND